MNWAPTPIPGWNDRRFPRRPVRPTGGGDGPEVILVLGLQRTASSATLDFLKANFASGRLIAREHGVSPRHRDWLERGLAIGLEGFADKLARLDRLWTALAAARRVRVAVTVREPASRARSFFLYRNRARLAAFHGTASGHFHDVEAIAADFAAFCRIEARRQAVWFDEELSQALGVDPSALRPGRFAGSTLDAGLEVGLVRREHAGSDLSALAAAIGPVRTPPRRRFGMEDFHIAVEARAFAATFPISDTIAAELSGAGHIARIYPDGAPTPMSVGMREDMSAEPTPPVSRPVEPLPSASDRPVTKRRGPARSGPNGMFQPLARLTIHNGSDLNEVGIRHRLRFAVPVRQPLVLISQIQRSGGTLLSQLLDGHSELHVHPGELHIGRPDKYRWPKLDLTAAPREMFEAVREHIAVRHAREGYQKLSGAEIAANPDHHEMILPFIFSGHLQAMVFERMLGSAPVTQRNALDAYVTSYFNAWLDYGGLYRDPATVRYWVGFVARLLAEPGQVERMFEDYPDGRMIVSLRSPESWLASARMHSDEYAETETALALWEAAHRRAMQIVSARPAMVRLVRFEQLVGDTEACMRGLAKFLGVAFEPSMLTPTFNRIPIASNSSFGAGYGVDHASLNRSERLDETTRAMVRARTADLYRRLGAIADYQATRVD